MITQYPVHSTWTPTPEQRADIEAQRVLSAQNRERRVVYESDPAFIAACYALEAQEGIEHHTICIFAGDRLGPIDAPDTFVTTPEKCLEVYRHFHPKPHDAKRERTEAALARSHDRDIRTAAQKAQAAEYDAYTTACRERKERIAAAQKRCNELVDEANSEYRRQCVVAAMQRDEAIREARSNNEAAKAEPVPSAPHSRQ